MVSKSAIIAADENDTDIRFPHVQHLTIKQMNKQKFSMKSLLNLLHGCPKLQKLNIEMVKNQGSGISKTPVNITRRLTESFISSNEHIGRAELMRFASDHPSLIELSLRTHRIAPDDVVAFIRRMKSLKIFHFILNHRSEYNRIGQTIG